MISRLIENRTVSLVLLCWGIAAGMSMVMIPLGFYRSGELTEGFTHIYYYQAAWLSPLPLLLVIADIFSAESRVGGDLPWPRLVTIAVLLLLTFSILQDQGLAVMEILDPRQRFR
jgi:hypothetical protein